jgi:hypothetical protein
MLEKARGETSAFTWLRAVSHPEVLDPFERRLLNMLRTSGSCEESLAEAGRRAFTGFLAFADLVNREYPATQRDQHGNPIPTTVERDEANAGAQGALLRLFGVVDALEVLAPRRPHEPPVPLRAAFPLLTGNPSPGATIARSAQ